MCIRIIDFISSAISKLMFKYVKNTLLNSTTLEYSKWNPWGGTFHCCRDFCFEICKKHKNYHRSDKNTNKILNDFIVLVSFVCCTCLLYYNIISKSSLCSVESQQFKCSIVHALVADIYCIGSGFSNPKRPIQHSRYCICM